MTSGFIRTNFLVAAMACAAILALPYVAMFVTNSTDIGIPLADFCAFLVTYAVIFFAVTFAVMTIAGKKFHLPVINLVFFLVLGVTIQYYLLSESLDILDGRNLSSYTTDQLIVDMMIYVLIGGLLYRFRSKVYKNILTLGTGVCLFQLINLGVLIQSHQVHFAEISRQHADVESISRFSREENVLHIVFDGFQSGLFQDIIDKDRMIASELKGFLYFPDTVTASEVTQLSFAAFLSGQEYSNNEPMSSYLFNNGLRRMGTAKPLQQPSNILEAASDTGFQVEVATPFVLLEEQEFYSQFFFIQRPYNSEVNHRRTIGYQASFILDLILFRSAPKILKGFVYNKGLWRFSRLSNPNPGMDFNHHASIGFLEDVTTNLSLSQQPRIYKLFHLITPHAPFVTNQNCRFSGEELDRDYANIYNQARCALLQFVRLLNQLKRFGIYDSATILVHGDHGIRLPFPEFEKGPDDDSALPRPIGNSNPLLLIKPPGGKGPLATIDAEISLTDIPKTMSALLQLNAYYDGVDFINEKPKNRVRRYFHTRQSRINAGRDDRFLNWNEYEISGPVRKRASWRKTGEINWTKKDFTEFPVADFLAIEKFELTDENAVQIRYQGRERHHFIAVGPDKRVTRFDGTDLITAKLRSRSDIERVCIVDTEKELRQCIY